MLHIAVTDDDLVRELEQLVAEIDACTAEHVNGVPDKLVAELERRWTDLAQRWIALARTGVPVSFEVLGGQHARWETHGESEVEHEIYWARLRVVNHWYKTKRPPALPDRRFAIGEASSWIAHLHSTLRYETALLCRTTDCDCEAATLVLRHPTAELVELGPHFDGYYSGDKLECPTCKALWFRGTIEDDRGGWFYERLRE